MVKWLQWEQVKDCDARNAHLAKFAKALFDGNHDYFPLMKSALVQKLGFKNANKVGEDDQSPQWHEGKCTGAKLIFNVYESTCGRVVALTYQSIGMKPCGLPRGGALYSEEGNFEKLKMSSFWKKMQNDDQKGPFEGIPAATVKAVLTQKASGFLCSIRCFRLKVAAADKAADEYETLFAIKSKNCFVRHVLCCFCLSDFRTLY